MDPVALYHRLPYGLKVAAASVHGLRLRRWRYGPETAGLVAAARARESWGPGRWAEWRERRVARVLARAAENVPAYAGRDPSDLAAWPRLEKADLRRRPDDFLDRRFDRRRLYREGTSGTSGTPLRLYWSRRTAREWYALVEARCRLWHGVSRRDRWAILGGQLVARAARREPPFWVWNAGLRQLYLSSYHLSATFLPHYVSALERHRVRYVLGYPSALAALAALVLDSPDPGRGRRLGLTVAIANAEPVLPQQRRLVGEAFGCPLRETYGMAELAAAASECEHGGLHLWPEVAHLELLTDGAGSEPAAPGETGRLVSTGLLGVDGDRIAQPLVRYEAGDRLRLAVDAGCPCGRKLPLLAAVEGRVDDVVVTPDGRRIGRLDPVFKTDLPIREAQIVQRAEDRVEALYVPSAGADLAALEKRLRRRLEDRLPGLLVELRRVEAIPRGAGGKFRAVVGLGRAQASS